MSLESWKKEFYPEEARDTFKTARESKIDVVEFDLVLVDSCLKKWKGLTKENLEKHECEILEGAVVSIGNALPKLRIDADSCSLCAAYFGTYPRTSKSCERCPLALVRGEVSCDDPRKDEAISPYQRFRSRNPSPEPMIFWLECARSFVERKRK